MNTISITGTICFIKNFETSNTGAEKEYPKINRTQWKKNFFFKVLIFLCHKINIKRNIFKVLNELFCYIQVVFGKNSEFLDFLFLLVDVDVKRLIVLLQTINEIC